MRIEQREEEELPDGEGGEGIGAVKKYERRRRRKKKCV